MSEQKQPTPQVSEASCDHHFATAIRGDEPVPVRVCQFCRQPDWVDLRIRIDGLVHERQAEALREAASEVMREHGTASLAAKRIRTQALKVDAIAGRAINRTEQ